MWSLVCKNAPLINDQFQALLVCILWATVGESEHDRFKKGTVQSTSEVIIYQNDQDNVC